MEVRRIGNIVDLSTVRGLVARLGCARIRGGPDGLLLAEGARLPFFVAGAMTVGNVVITGGRFSDLLRALPQVLAHESRHAARWLRWGGLPFLPAHLVGAAWSLLRTGDRGAGNPSERAAGLEDGGYLAR